MSKNWLTYTKRRVSYGVLGHFNVALLLLFRFFQVIGNLLCRSDFEDVVFESGERKNGCIKSVLDLRSDLSSGSDYNSAWIVHNAVSKALERLLLTRFLTEESG